MKERRNWKRRCTEEGKKMYKKANNELWKENIDEKEM